MIRLAAFEPDIAQNLGSMIRMCACFDVPLEVIEPCGFPFSIKALRRSAMDYAELAKVTRHDSWEAYYSSHTSGRIVLLTTKSDASLWNFNFEVGDTLLVGRESAGVPQSVADQVDAALRLPMPGGGRSLNVAVTAGIAVAEALRQTCRW